jgi:hypothetical protein
MGSESWPGAEIAAARGVPAAALPLAPVTDVDARAGIGGSGPELLPGVPTTALGAGQARAGLVLAPPPVVAGRAGGAGDAGAAFAAPLGGMASAAGSVRGAAAGGFGSAVGLSFAPLDRPAAQELAAPPAPPEGAAPVSGETGGAGEHGQDGGADLDQLADEVFAVLRWRLAAERERMLG